MCSQVYRRDFAYPYTKSLLYTKKCTLEFDWILRNIVHIRARTTVMAYSMMHGWGSQRSPFPCHHLDTVEYEQYFIYGHADHKVNNAEQSAFSEIHEFKTFEVSC